MSETPTIVQKGDPVLHTPAEPVAVEEITSDRVQKILEDMKGALDAEYDGVGLAAPQIGVPLQIFIISPRAFEAEDAERQERGEEPVGNIPESHLVFINPHITKTSKKRYAVPEGCLSVRWIYGTTDRADKATVSAYDEQGKKFTRGASGLIAQIFQHEVDHLNGILFTDHARDLEEVDPESLQQNHEQT